MRKELRSVIIAFSLFIFLLTPAKSQETDTGVELLAFQSEITINTTETKSIDLIVINNQDFEDTLLLSVWPQRSLGIMPTFKPIDKIDVSPHSNSTIKLFFSVPADIDEVRLTFQVTVKSKTNPNVSHTEEVFVNVVRKTDVYISDLILDKYFLDSEDCVAITTSITNVGSDSGPYRLQTEIKTGTLTLERFDDFIEMIEGRSMKSVSHSYCFEKYALAGEYSVETTLKTGLNKFVHSRRPETLTMRKESNLVYDKSVTYTPFAQIKTIKVRNEGNSVEREFYVTETVSDFISKFFYPETPVALSESVDGKVSYKWLVDKLEPGKEIEIKYEIRFFSIWFSGLVLIILIFFAFTYVYRPRIKKSARVIGPLKRGKDIFVLIELKNSTIHEIKNLIVKDTVPQIARLEKRFETIKPDIKKVEAGTELTWKIKSLLPLEERVLTYRIKPVVDIIGSIRLPSATMSYVNHKKEKKSTSSKSVEIK